jgi:2-polyprenyl-6-methoxyphenol hydroxylase-like FAD-dependent oxidoreductase
MKVAITSVQRLMDYTSQRQGSDSVSSNESLTDGANMDRFGYDFFVLDRELVLRVLYNHIADNSKVLLNKRISTVGHFDDKVVVHCTDGSSYEGDILAGADGVHSKTRHEMWRLADEVEPGRISEKDKTSMFAEYRCLFGISSKTEGMQKGMFDITFTKGTSTIAFVGQGSRVFWFIYKRMDQIYPVGKIPKFTKEDSYAFAEANCDMNLMPKGSVKFRDLWKNRLAYMLVLLEEAEYDTWAWGRIACIGDGIYKTTPNAGSGGNAAIESAAVLANSIKALSDRCEQTKPSVQEVTEALMDY